VTSDPGATLKKRPPQGASQITVWEDALPETLHPALGGSMSQLACALTSLTETVHSPTVCWHVKDTSPPPEK
jgi:hypothetical protein